MLRAIVLLAALAAASFLLVSPASAATAQAKLRKSESVVRWYENAGHWTLRPRYEKCADLRSQRAADRCYRHRQGYRWHRERVERLTPKPVVLSPVAAIQAVFGSYAGEALAVARCESGLSVWASNGQYLGLFQMGSSERAHYGHGSTALEQALAAHRYFVAAGGWGPWQCKPW